MAHTIPNVITPGSLRNGDKVQQNDAANLAALLALMGRWRPLYQAFGENSGLGAGDPTILRTSSMSASDSNGPHFIFPIVAADLTITNMSLQFRLVATMVCGSDEPDTTLTFGLHAFTGAGTTNFSPTVGTPAVTGSTAAITNVNPSVTQTATSSSFTPPANGAYAFAITTTADTVSTLDYSFVVQLQYRHV